MERSKRDLRVDFCRGVALLVIFWDHVVVMIDNPSFFFRLTPRHWGFSDAAELFVFLSGYVFGIVYGRILVSGGFMACQRKAFRRVGQIYAANGLAMLTTWGVVAAFFYGAGVKPNYLQEFFQEPVAMLMRSAVLNYLPWNFSILPLYMVILAAMPVMLVLLRKNVLLGLGLSLALYTVAQLFPGLNLPRYHGVNGQWTFNPLAWQLLFTVAASLGMGALDRTRIPRSRLLLAIALAILAIGPVLRAGYIITDHDLFGSGQWKSLFSIHFPYHSGRTNLSPLRLTHFFAVLYVGSWFLPRDNRVWQHPVLLPVVNSGQHSLVVFSISIVLSCLIDLSSKILHGGALVLLVLLLTGTGILLFTGNVLTARKAAQRTVPRPAEPQPGTTSS